MAKEGDTYKFIRFGQQGVSGAGKILQVLKIKHVRKVITQDTMHKTLSLVSSVLVIGHIK